MSTYFTDLSLLLQLRITKFEEKNVQKRALTRALYTVLSKDGQIDPPPPLVK